MSSKFFRDARRDPQRGMVAGVCAGIANYFEIGPKWVRVTTVLLTIFVFGPFMFAVYAALWYLLDPIETPASARAPHPGYETPAPSSPSVRSVDLNARFAGLAQRLGYLEECVSSKEFELRREFRKLET